MPLPGSDAQLKMAPSMRRIAAGDSPLKDGSVMILLYPYKKSIHTLFMKRAEYEGVHSGQISFPGGMYESKDINLENTALRETQEETGIPANSLQVLGQLTTLHIPVSNIKVYPFVAALKERPVCKPNPGEVDYLIETKLEDLVNPLNLKSKTLTIIGNTVQTPYYDIVGDHIWGATAMILSEFLEIAMRAGIC